MKISSFNKCAFAVVALSLFAAPTSHAFLFFGKKKINEPAAVIACKGRVISAEFALKSKLIFVKYDRRKFGYMFGKTGFLFQPLSQDGVKMGDHQEQAAKEIVNGYIRTEIPALERLLSGNVKKAEATISIFRDDGFYSGGRWVKIVAGASEGQDQVTCKLADAIKLLKFPQGKQLYAEKVLLPKFFADETLNGEKFLQKMSNQNLLTFTHDAPEGKERLAYSFNEKCGINIFPGSGTASDFKCVSMIPAGSFSHKNLDSCVQRLKDGLGKSACESRFLGRNWVSP